MLPRALRRYARDLGLLTIGLAAGAAAHYFLQLPWLTQKPDPRAAEAVDAHLKPQSSAAVAPEDPASDKLAAQLAAAVAERDRLRAERELEWKQTAALVDALLEVGQLEATETYASIQPILERLRKRFEADADEFLGQIDELLFFALFFSESGPEVKREIVRTIRNPNVDAELRKNLLGSLAFVPGRESLELYLDPPADLAEDIDLSDAMDGMAMTASMLPPAEMSPFAPRLYDEAMQKLAESPDDDGAWSLLGVLAFDLDYTPARTVIGDPDNLELLGGELLEMAWWIGSDDSRALVERIQRSHRDPELREKASKILALW